jgi:hypothetical protein
MAAETTPSSDETPEINPQVEVEAAPAEVVEQPEPAKPLPKRPRKGVHVLQAGDTPATVSVKFYGRSHMAVPLVRANPESNWATGDTITLV